MCIMFITHKILVICIYDETLSGNATVAVVGADWSAGTMLRTKICSNEN